MSSRVARRLPALALCAALLAASCSGGAHPGPSGSSSSSGQPRPIVTYRLRVAPASFSLHVPLQREVAVSLDNVIYLAGGLGPAGTSANGVFSLDPSTGALTLLGAVPQAFHDGAGAVIGGELFVFGGGAGESSNAVQAFDLQTHRGRLAGRLPRPLSDLSSAATADGTVYLAGGWDGSKPNAEVWSTTDGRTFRGVASLPEGLRYAAVVASGRDVVVAGGMDATGKPVDTIFDVNTATGRVTAIGRLPQAVGHASAFSLGGRLYVAGGLDANGHAVRQVVEIDPARRLITPRRPLPRAVSDAGTVVSAGAAWLVGGWRGAAVSQILRAMLVRHVASPKARPSGSP